MTDQEIIDQCNKLLEENNMNCDNCCWKNDDYSKYCNYFEGPVLNSCLNFFRKDEK